MIKFLIISLVIIYLLSRFAGYFFRFAFWLFGKQIEKKIREQAAYQAASSNPKPEGTIEIITPNPRSGSRSNDAGEYVQYEEVK